MFEQFDPTVFAGLEPAPVWAHFATLCAIPRASKHEHELRDHLKAWADSRQLTTLVDPAGNLIIRKPASRGRENVPGLVLQAHLDMVCQKNRECSHDFSSDPITPRRRDGWLVAEATTLGADNGIGVALILAVLEDDSLQHGPLEALLTVDEEAGMGGARGLASGVLQSKLMLNLDTEVWGEFYLGCAGGLDVNVERTMAGEPLPVGYECARLNLHGLRGGHSGVDIHEGRGNAIKLLVRVLCELAGRFCLRLGGVQGGSARNALPREASALIALPAEAMLQLPDLLKQSQQDLSQELSGVDDGVQLELSPDDFDQVLTEGDTELWLNTLNAAPHGVFRMSRQLAGVVETSNNLGMLEVQPGLSSCNFMVRSLQDSCSIALANQIRSLFALSGTAVEFSGHYPGWTPNPDSPLLALCQQVYRQDFKDESRVQVIHAGLECGIIGAKYPALDIVSFGPNIHGAHAPGESVEIASVERCWKLLTAILAQIS